MRGSPGSHWEKWLSFLEYIWKTVFCLSKDKRLLGATECCSAAQDRGVHRGWITWSQLLTMLSQQTSATLHVCSETAFLGQNGVRCTPEALFRGKEACPCLLGPLKYGILNSSHWPEIKHKRTVGPGQPMARYRQDERSNLTKA